MNHTVSRAVEDEEGNGVERDDQHHPEHLLIKVPPAPANHEYSKWSGTTPVGGEGEQAGQQRDGHLLPAHQPPHIPDLEEYKAPQQWPRYACGVEEQVAERIESGHIEITKGEVAHHSQHEQAAQIASEVMGMIVALGHEENHHRSRQTSDRMQCYLQWCFRLLIGLNTHPRKMINRHRDDSNDFQCVAAQSFHHQIYKLVMSYYYI